MHGARLRPTHTHTKKKNGRWHKKYTQDLWNMPPTECCWMPGYLYPMSPTACDAAEAMRHAEELSSPEENHLFAWSNIVDGCSALLMGLCRRFLSSLSKAHCGRAISAQSWWCGVYCVSRQTCEHAYRIWELCNNVLYFVLGVVNKKLENGGYL